MALNSTLTASFDAFRSDRRMMGWNTPEDYMSYVHPYWKTFEAPNPFLHYTLGFFYIIFMFCALMGNGVVIWIFTSCKSLRTPSNMLVVNLAILDFIMMLKTPIFIMNSYNEGPIWGKLGCDIFALLGSYNGIGSAMNNAAIAYDRHRTIARPLDGKLTRKQVTLMIVAIWAWATPFSVMPFLGIWGRFVPEGFLTTCTFDYMTEDSSTKFFVGTIFFYSYIIPLALLIFYYSKIVQSVGDHEKTLRDQAKKMNVTSLRSNRDQNEKSAEVRIAKVAIALATLFVVAWTPYAFVALTAAFGNRSVLTPLMSMIPACCCKGVACINPWMYAINHPRYRMELQKKMPWFCVHEPAPTDDLSLGSATTEMSGVVKETSS
ncbi:opsin, ultraviolet-sensitive-like [Daphnia carinata]|uniref:opsin, ultraviolet-sensitive-like n=1 Tax=Daphnia carinata TaxID=120202 RepID=UPI00257B4402|nr:opsin, ultraviolet-sensitive-like [Daphnia carinata]